MTDATAAARQRSNSHGGTATAPTPTPTTTSGGESAPPGPLTLMTPIEDGNMAMTPITVAITPAVGGGGGGGTASTSSAGALLDDLPTASSSEMPMVYTRPRSVPDALEYGELFVRGRRPRAISAAERGVAAALCSPDNLMSPPLSTTSSGKARRSKNATGGVGVGGGGGSSPPPA